MVEQIRPRTSQVYNLWTAIPVLLETSALETIERITDPFASTDYAFVLVVAETALIADPSEGSGPYVGIADGTFPVAFVAETTERYTGCFAAHYEIGVVAGHD